MTANNDKLKERYQPIVQKAKNFAGISLNSAKEGQKVNVLQRGFFTSYENNHRRIFEQILGSFSCLNINNLNQVLITIRGNTANIYKDYPMMMKIVCKEKVSAGRFIFRNQVLDVTHVKFKDSVYEIDIRDGDKLIWLFRNGWNFGLYFDFSEKLLLNELGKNLGWCYRQLEYHSAFSLLSDNDNFNLLLGRGWFPFIQILGEQFDVLMNRITKEGEIEIAESTIIDFFSEDKIEEFTCNWWENKIFSEKKNIIMAGVAAYHGNSKSDIINCIKNISSEIEGIIRLDYHRKYGKKPSFKELKSHVENRGSSKFNLDSLGFPRQFYQYLNDVFFRNFDLEKEDVRLSRHSTLHGVATQEEYTKARALQLILTLDQIYFYLKD